MTRTTQERPIEAQACIAFVGLSVVVATLGFFAKGWLPGSLLMVAMGVVVFLLSRAVERVQEAWMTKNWFTAIVAGVLAFGFGVIEANLNHIGLDHLNTAYDLAPADFIWPACFFISGVNVFASFGFARVLEDHREQKTQRTVSADALVFGARHAPAPPLDFSAFRKDAEIAKRMENVRQKMQA